MSDDLDQLLVNLKLKRLREIIPQELAWAEKKSPSYTEFLCRILRQEYQAQQDRFLDCRIRRSKLPERWSLKTFPWKRQPGVDRKTIEQLGELGFLERGSNLVLIGPTGVGKTGIGSALLLQALYRGYRGRFVKAQDLFDEVYTTLADRSTRKLLDHLARLDLLLIDEMSYLNLRPEQSNIFFKLMDERYQTRKATIITTNLDYEEWYAFLGHKDMVSALLDRLRHRCQTIKIDGPSLRDPEE